MAPLSGAEKESACVFFFLVTFVLFWARFSTLGTIGANKYSRDQKKTKRDLFFFFSGKGSLHGGLKSSPAPSKREQSTSLIRM